MISLHWPAITASAVRLKRYDSTMIQVFGHLASSMKVGNSSKNKRQVKLTTELENEFGVRMKFFDDQPHLSEETTLKELIQQVQPDQKDLIVFDRGLKSRQAFPDFAQNNTQFVTWLNDNTAYQVLRGHQPLAHIAHDAL